MDNTKVLRSKKRKITIIISVVAKLIDRKLLTSKIKTVWWETRWDEHNMSIKKVKIRIKIHNKLITARIKKSIICWNIKKVQINE